MMQVHQEVKNWHLETGVNTNILYQPIISDGTIIQTRFVRKHCVKIYARWYVLLCIIFINQTLFFTDSTGYVSNQKHLIINHLRSQLLKFRDGWLKLKAWKYLVSDNDADNLYKESDVFAICHKCKYLFHCIDMVINNYAQHTFSHCIKLAIKKIDDFKSSNKINDVECSIRVRTVNAVVPNLQ